MADSRSKVYGWTENAPANIALAKTIRLALEEQEEAYYTAKEINSFLRKEVEFLGGHILSPANALPYILNISFDAITSEVLQNALDQKGNLCFWQEHMRF